MKKFNSFADLGKSMGVKEKPKKEPREMKCAICGAKMHHVAGTNVNICTGKNEKGEACGRTALRSVRPGMQAI